MKKATAKPLTKENEVFKRIFDWFKGLFKSKPKPVPAKPVPVEPKDPPKLGKPKEIKGKKMKLWATFYYLPKMTSDKSGVELRDMKGNKLGYKLSNSKFCNLAMQGSGVVDGVVIGFQGRGKTKQANCSYSPSNYVRFHKDPNKYGTGVRNWAITPFKSIAVDPKWIPYGSIVYIPAAVGTEYTFEGEKHVHDGIFYAQDTGGKIKTNHIDVYLGPVDSVLGNWRDALNANPFKFIKSKESGTFEAIILDEDQDPDDITEPDDGRDNIDPDKPDDGGDDRDYDKFPEDEEKLWYPKALRSSYKMRTRGTYKKKYPQGAVVHFTAGRSRNRSEGGSKNTETHLAQGKRGVRSAADKGSFAYFVIDRAGNVHQNFPLDRWGYHAGTSAWKGLSGSVSDELVGIEIQNAGKLSDTYKNSSKGKSYKCPEGKLAAWFTRPNSGDKFFDKEKECRYHKGEDNIAKGWYHKYSPEQEEALLELLIWMKRNNPDVFDIDLILGHDEVAGPKGIGRWRKTDPGASLSMTMSEFRQLVEKTYNDRYKS